MGIMTQIALLLNNDIFMSILNIISLIVIYYLFNKKGFKAGLVFRLIVQILIWMLNMTLNIMLNLFLASFNSSTNLFENGINVFNVTTIFSLIISLMVLFVFQFIFAKLDYFVYKKTHSLFTFLILGIILEFLASFLIACILTITLSFI